MQAPYLSVVATARNDDHGGNLLGRLQAFVNGLIGQAKRHQVPLELVLVEWNPPPERPRLAEALRWPADFGPASVRLIEVPPEIHGRYRHAAALPLYQMIAKNVGIRRARGEFILATNIDILFSDELFELLAARRLEPNRMYRVDRFDVMADVPVDGPVDVQLAWCRSHLLRRHTRVGSLRLTPDGHPHPSEIDVVMPESGISFGAGWFLPESHAAVVYRWAGQEAELEVAPPPDRHVALALELEPGPGVGFETLVLEIRDAQRRCLEVVEVRGRSELILTLPFGSDDCRRLRLRTRGGGRRVPYDTRILNFRVFRAHWVGPEAAAVVVRRASQNLSGWQRAARLGARWWRAAHRLALLPAELRRATQPVRLGLPFPAQLIEKLQLRLEGGGLTIALGPRAKPVVSPAPEPRPEEPDVLHTNGCGDFTLFAREHWFALRGYPEFDLFSMNLDAVLCFAAHYAGVRETVLPDPVRIYHIEHATGSGWTPEGDKQLFERLASAGIPWLPYSEVAAWAEAMHYLGRPMIFNLDDWGLAREMLREIALPCEASRQPAGVRP
ncbi:MAG: hypothetical protein RMK57_00830 [Bryobacterales bacterium]|nr:hypothetical protein [Bryobacteraceae bacterium]MDW8353049.1 hypothetical protein [Bryobacterales bacterium]